MCFAPKQPSPPIMPAPTSLDETQKSVAFTTEGDAAPPPEDQPKPTTMKRM